MIEETYDELRARLVKMIERYIAFWETGDLTYSSWPGDPDGGELRLIAALREVVEHPRTLPVVLERLSELLETDAAMTLSFPEFDGECMFAGCGNTDVAPALVKLSSGYTARACLAHTEALPRV